MRNPLLLSSCVTYCSLSGGAERRRRDGIVLSTKSLIVTAEEKALLGGGGVLIQSGYVLHASAGKMSSYAGGSSLGSG